MRLAKIGSVIEDGIHWVTTKSIWVTSGILFIMTLIVTIDVIGRNIFNRPFKGAMEYDQILMVLLVSLTLGYATYKKRHIVVDVLISRLRGRTKEILHAVWYFIAAVITTLITWQMGLWGFQNLMSSTGRRTLYFEIPEAPFILVTSIGILLMCLELWIQFIHSVARSTSKSKDELEELAKPIID